MQTDLLLSLSSVLGDYKQRRDEYLFRCPFCDTEDKLYVNLIKEKYVCHKCLAIEGGVGAGSLHKLCRLLHIKPSQAPVLKLSALDEAFKSVYHLEHDDGDGSEDKTTHNPIEYPIGYISAFDDPRILEYALSRGISEEDVRDLKLGSSLAEYYTRLYIPDFNDKGDLIYYTARSVYGKHPKYKAAAGLDASKFLYRWYKLRNVDDWIYICEGPISAIVASPNAVCTYNKYVSPTQISMLLSMKSRRFVICTDPDAILNEGMSLSHILLSRGRRIKILDIPKGHDTASLGREKVLDLFENAKEISNIIELSEKYLHHLSVVR